MDSASVGFESDEAALIMIRRARINAATFSSSVNAAERLVMRRRHCWQEHRRCQSYQHEPVHWIMQNQLMSPSAFAQPITVSVMLTQNRRLMMGALQHDEGLADF